MEKLEKGRHFPTATTEEDQEDSVEEEHAAPRGFFEVILDTWRTSFSLWFNFFATFTVFLGVFAQWQPEFADDVWNSKV